MTRRIIIVDDHPLFRAALRQTLSGGTDDIAVEEASGLDALTAALEADRDCDLVLLDLNMPGGHGLSGLLLGWTPRLRGGIQRKAAQNLAAYLAKHPG